MSYSLNNRFPHPLMTMVYLYIMVIPHVQSVYNKPSATGIEQVVQTISAGNYGRVQSLLITQKGKLVHEYYFNGSHKDDVHTMQSVSKSISSLLIGIAIEKGLIKSEYDTVEKYLSGYSHYFLTDTLKKKIRIIDLLNMQSGFLWSEFPYRGSDLETLNQSSKDWADFVLSRPMKEYPGSFWQYNSGGAVLLSRILWNVTGIRTDSFAAASLFNPLGITNAKWYHAPFDSLPHTGGGLLLTARALSTIGSCILNKGMYEGKQVIPEQWLTTSFTPKQATSLMGYSVYHEYLWWLFPLNPEEENTSYIITASGAQGQWLFMIPEKETVIVLTGNAVNTPDKSIALLYEQILPFLNTAE